MPSLTAIANDALSLIGGDRVDDIDQQTALAAELREKQADALAMLLEDFPWAFAERRKILSEPAGGSDDPYWLHAYQIPSDCAAIRRIMPRTLINDQGSQPFSVSETLIYANIEDAAAWYTAKGVPPGRWPQTFADYLAAEMAVRLQPTQRAGEKIVQRLMLTWEMRKAKAEAHSTRQRQIRLLDDLSSFERARDG